MRKLLLILPVSLLLWACGDDAETESEGSEGEEQTSDSGKVDALKQEIDQLKQENARKDSMMVQTARTFDEIADNLSQIAYKQGRIRREGLTIESQEDPKEWILQEIEEINRLREENAKKIGGLQATLKQSQQQNSELEAENQSLQTMIDALNNQIGIQEQEIEMLKVQLDDLDKDYATMFDAYLDMADRAEDAMTKLNTAYYAYGTKRELLDNGVITKEGGFIGLGKTSVLKSDFNDKYFEELDISQKKEFAIIGEKPEIITTHPSSSYDLRIGDESSVLVVNEPEKFWGASKYLVIVVK